MYQLLRAVAHRFLRNVHDASRLSFTTARQYFAPCVKYEVPTRQPARKRNYGLTEKRRAGGGRWQIWGCEKGDEERKYKKKVGNLMMA